MPSVLRQRPRHIAECHADVHRRVDFAGMSGMHGLMAAVTHANSNVFGIFHDVSRSLIVQYVNGIIAAELKRRFLHIDTSQFRFRGKEEILYKLLLHIHILVIEFAQIFLIDITADTHQRKLNKSPP